MDDFLGSKSNIKRRTLNQKKHAIGTNFNTMANGFSAATSSTNYRTNNVLPDDDVVSVFFRNF